MAFDPIYDNLLAAVKDATNTGVREAGIDVRVGDPVERVVAPRGSGARDRHGQVGTRAALASGNLAGRSETEGDVRAQRYQAEEIAAV